MTGTLFIVSTPIGNLEDISVRALRVLREVDVIAAEDTRRTAGLLAHYGIGTPTLSLHLHNERARVATLLGKLRAGEHVAVVADAGTPLVSDPGAMLVAAVREAGIRVEAIPGPSAVLAALVAAGLPAETFSFLGFPPSRAGSRRTWLQALAAEPRTVIFFEAPHRIRATLEALAEIAPERPLAVARELTKLHEEIITGTAAEAPSLLRTTRGEFTIVVGPPTDDQALTASIGSDEELWRDFCALTAQPGTSRRGAVATLARRYGRSARDVYSALERSKPRD